MPARLRSSRPGRPSRAGGRDVRSPLEGRALELRNPVDVTLCMAIGRGSTGRAGRPVGLGLDWRANVEQTWSPNSLHEGAWNGYNPRSEWVRRQGLEPRTRRLRVRCFVRFFSPIWCHVMTIRVVACCSVRLPVSGEGCGYRVLPGRTGTYRDVRANMEQTSVCTGLDHHGRGRLDPGDNRRRQGHGSSRNATC